MSFFELFKTNLRVSYRNYAGIFWTIGMPGFIYIALSVLPIGKITGGTIAYSNFVLPGIIAMVLMQGGIYGLAYWVVDLKARGILKRFMVTPLKKSELVLSLVAARTILTFVQTVVLTLLGVIVFRATFAGNIIATILFVALGGAVFLLFGLFIATLADTYEAAAPITTGIGLPLTFLGNIFFSTEGLPKVLKIVANLLPITYLADGLRKVYLYSFDFSTIWKDYLMLSLWFVFMLIVVIRRFKLEE
jgi:ABC-2 type transport system permease protein